MEVVRELLARGAAVNAATNGGATPLFLAIQKGHFEVVRELLARGAAVTPRKVSHLCTPSAAAVTWKSLGSCLIGAPRWMPRRKTAPHL